MYVFFDVNMNIIQTSGVTIPVSVDTFDVSYSVITVATDNIFLDFKLSPCSKCCMLSSG
jgi:hypothetical protein